MIINKSAKISKSLIIALSNWSTLIWLSYHMTLMTLMTVACHPSPKNRLLTNCVFLKCCKLQINQIFSILQNLKSTECLKFVSCSFNFVFSSQGSKLVLHRNHELYQFQAPQGWIGYLKTFPELLQFFFFINIGLMTKIIPLTLQSHLLIYDNSTFST